MSGSSAVAALAPIVPDLYAGPPGAERLIAGRRADGSLVFPLPTGPERETCEPVALAREGALWSFTIQRFRPKSPPYAGADDERTFTPFAVGYVELPGQIIVESRIEIDDPARLAIGMAMELVIVPFARSGGRAPVATYAFRPAERAGEANSGTGRA